MDYLSIHQVSEKWDISVRRIQVLCTEEGLKAMGSAYVGKTLIKPSTKLLYEVVTLKKENPIEYARILEGAKTMIESKESTENQFKIWLSNRASSAQVSELYAMLEMLDKFCRDRKIIKQPLLETEDRVQIAKVRETVAQNHIFKFMHKKQINKMSIALKYYISYIKELSSAEEVVDEGLYNVERVRVPSADDSYTTADMEVSESSQSNGCIEQRKEDFVAWMIEHGMAEWTAGAYASACELVGKVAIEHNILDREVWKITDAEVLKQVLDQMLVNQEFIEKNESRHNQFRAAFVKYIQFSEDYSFKPRGAYEYTENRVNDSFEDELIKNENHELYMRLRSMSRVYDEPNGLTIDEIRTMIDVEIERDVLKDILDRITWITKVDDNVYSFSKNAKNIEKVIEFNRNSFVRVLMMRYPGGMRFDSIDLENFKETYSDIVGEKIEMSDKDLENCLRKCGVMWQSRLFPAEGIIDNASKEKILTYINKNFDSGKHVLYYKAIYNDLSDVFVYCVNLTDAMMLKPYLEYISEPGDFFFAEEYLSKEQNVSVNHSKEIEEFLMFAGKPLSYDEIYVGLSHISSDVIYKEIKTNRKIILNEKEHYFHYNLFELSSEDADKITEFINDEIAEEGYCIWSHVYSRVKDEIPLFIENNIYLSSLGIRNAIAKKLSGRFEFESEVIGAHGQSINMATVYQLYGMHHAPFSDEDIYSFSKEISRGFIYFDSLAEHTVRVSKALFIAKNQIDFDVDAIDKALATYLTTGYMLIKDVDSFLIFPNVGYEWNSFLLESYLMYYSKDYTLCNNGKSLNNVAGALVKKGSGYDEFEDVCADVLANGYVDLTRTEALNFLADQNLLTRKSYAGIDKAIMKARQIRNRKG